MHLREVIVHLHPHPRIGGAAQGLLKPHGHLRRDSAAARNDIVQLLARDAERLGRVADRYTKLFETAPE